ncbi:putative quinol monooxygenase [Kocuria palustris]|uniref:putative quinol monooxygenase n=1 Tax=Kocuria palustris TaxID=71999 RepID=UPI00119D5239|nr:putative quinol monooxygenase [Kocuria palustris]
MIFIVVKFPVKPEHSAQWTEISREFTEATRAEPGNKFFDWSRSVDDVNDFVLVEGFDDDAAEAHVESEHFKKMQQEFPQYLRATPQIISEQIGASDWGEMAEVKVD